MDLDDASTLLALLNGKRATPVGGMLSGWDMLQASAPSRDQLADAAAVLVGSGLAIVDGDGAMLLTPDGVAVRNASGPVRGMRELPAALRALLAERELRVAASALPDAALDAAYAVLDAKHERPAKRWWRRR